MTATVTKRSFELPRDSARFDMPDETPAKTKITFNCQAAGAKEVLLVGDFTGWEQAPIPLKKTKGGPWSKTVPLPPGRYEYRLLVDGKWCDDPQCEERSPNQFGGHNCVCVVS